MFGIDPNIIAIFCVVFIGLGIFNIFSGLKKLRIARAQGQKTTWYKQLSILTGAEYILLAIAFLVSLSFSYHWLPSSWNGIITPFYLVVLFSSAILAGIVIFQSINSRQRRRATQGVQTTPQNIVSSPDEMTPEQRAAYRQRRRERRQKAATARRRRTGRVQR
ncbi:hypothetical protein EPA93_18525 [Ktedonosporobacter rubrisoli]|uniref:Uncharacterized protein n=1 Tax=Ktedonosporobacter rubrisoli TaxID=2509675 RepID=A0A4P6JR08_KTERU|nr:hypothetical protein [Ktedonosporobacter rubrisoli]QBD77879.1 hypothetical protein EPA93_18525 [Ktedonosporobacter rubrisoli]